MYTLFTTFRESIHTGPLRGSVAVEEVHRVVQHVGRTRQGDKTANEDSYAVEVIIKVHFQ